ncbi:hypothetical protein GCM10023068_43680 [Leifsonia shinshuensis]
MLGNRLYEAQSARQSRTDWRGLVADTAAGPVFRRGVNFDVIPMSSALALIRELAERAVDGGSRPASSYVKRLTPDEAYEAHALYSTHLSLTGAKLDTRYRLWFYRRVADFARRTHSIDGVESVYATALNGAWPALSVNQIRDVLPIAKRLGTSEFANARSVVVIDPGTFTITVLGPGEVRRADLEGWLEWRAEPPPSFGPDVL